MDKKTAVIEPPKELIAPDFIYLLSYPNPPADQLHFIFEQIRQGSIDYVIIETLMSGLIPTKGEYSMCRFATDSAELVPTFFIPQDSKADERRVFFYSMDCLPYGIVPLDKAYSAINGEVSLRMIDAWNESRGPKDFIRQIRREYQDKKRTDFE